jgi:NDP-sugar pyrophosphorylase family protein
MTDSLAPVCILAGGLATRLGEHARTIPKALVEVAGAPFIFHQLALLRRHGAERVVLCIGHLGDQIERAVGDGAAFGLEVAYSHDGPRPVGTAGAVRAALPLLGDAFLVLYGDTYLRIDYQAVQRTFEASAREALMTVLRNEGRWDTSNAVFDGILVTAHDKRHPTPEMRWIDYGLGALTAAAARETAPDATDLSEIYRRLADRGDLAGYEATERFYEIGTPAALAETDAFLRLNAPAPPTPGTAPGRPGSAGWPPHQRRSC